MLNNRIIISLLAVVILNISCDKENDYKNDYTNKYSKNPPTINVVQQTNEVRRTIGIREIKDTWKGDRRTSMYVDDWVDEEDIYCKRVQYDIS